MKTAYRTPSRSTAWTWWLSYSVVTGALYGLVTHLPRAEPWVVPGTAIDATVPLAAWTAWPYASYFLLLPVLVQFCRRRAWFVDAFLAACLASIACLASHHAFPTIIARPALGDEASGLLALIHLLDTPLGAFPSGHVALPVAITLVLAARRTRWAAVYAGWTLVLAVAVLTTRQHVLWDVIGGMAVGSTAAATMLIARRCRVNLRSLGAIAAEWLVVAAALALALRADAWWSYAAAFVVVATRQHALLMLYHDAVHQLLAGSRRANDTIINATVGVPHVLPMEIYRPLHIAHHRHLGTRDDPERRFLYANQPWRYRPLATGALCRQLLGDLTGVNAVRTTGAWRRAGGRVGLRPATWCLVAAWAAALALLAWHWPAPTGKILLLWFVPLATLTNLLQKIRSFAEHSAGPNVTPGWRDWSYSWRTGLLGRLTLWPYHINLHREHHARPTVPWHDLPNLTSPRDPALRASGLLSLLWQPGAEPGRGRGPVDARRTVVGAGADAAPAKDPAGGVWKARGSSAGRSGAAAPTGLGPRPSGIWP